MRELKLKYIVELASNIGKTSQAEAKILEEAQKRMDAAVGQTAKETGKLATSATQVGKATKDTSKAVEEAHKRMQAAIDKSAQETGALTAAVDKVTKGVEQFDRRLTALAANTSTQRQLNYMEALGRGIERNVQKAQNLSKTLALATLDKLPEIAGGTYAAGKTGVGPLKQYANLEQAQTDLQIAMMPKSGGVSKYYGPIIKEANDLGNQLPGTTKDFVEGALALKANGTPDSVIASGGLRSSSYLGVLLHMNQEASAEMVARARESYGLTGEQLPKAADRIQRARFGLGIKPEEITAANTYMGNTLNTVGWTGLGSMDQVLAMQGLGQQQGMAGSVFGTNMKDFITRLALSDTRLNKKSKEAKHVRGLMHEYGIGKFEVFGPDGTMLPPVEIARQMEQFNKLKPQERIEAFHQIFGDQGGQIAQMLAAKGANGIRDKMAIMDDQGDLNTKLAMTTKTLQNTFEALTGTLENVEAQAAKPLGEGVKRPINAVTDWLSDTVMPSLEEHPLLGTAAIGAAGVGSFAAGAGTVNALRKYLLNKGGGAATAAAEAAAKAAPAARAAGVMVGQGGGGWAAAAAENAAATAAAERRAVLMGRARWAGRALGALGYGLETYGVLTDDQLTAAGKVRGVGKATAGAGGAWGGAAAGAALGSLLFPGVGTVVGGALGGLAGYWGVEKGFDHVWNADPSRDYVHVTAPNGALLGTGSGPQQVIQLGEGKLQVDVHLRDERSFTTQSVIQPLPLISLNPGATNPGGF